MFLEGGGEIGGCLFDLEVTSYGEACVIDAVVSPDVLRCSASVGIVQISIWPLENSLTKRPESVLQGHRTSNKQSLDWHHDAHLFPLF